MMFFLQQESSLETKPSRFSET